MNKTALAINVVTGCLLFSCTGQTESQKKYSKTIKEKPNIIFILADDLDYGDLGCFGQKMIQTPNIDRIASEGIKFTNAYAGNSVCAPSRSCLMEGKHPGHARVRGNGLGMYSYRESLREGDYTVAMLLKEAGYATGLFGKWGLAVHNQYGIPNRMGFDEFFGYLNQQHAHNHYPEFLYHNRERVYFPENGTHHEDYRGDHFYDENGVCHPRGIDEPSKAKYAFDVYCEKSLEFVRKNKDNPFFLYLAYTPPHGSFIVPELGIYTHKEWPLSHKIYAAMITRMDNEVGKLLNLLQELNIDDNTLIFFTSDNGSTKGNAKPGETPGREFFNKYEPTRGGKNTIYHGAFHVPAMARWPEYIQPGQVNDHIWAFWDFLPSAAEIAGMEPPEDTDGISILPTLLGQHDKQKKHEFLYWEYREEQAVRMGDWYAYKNSGGKFELYDIVNDPEQEKDLSAEFPDIIARIDSIMKAEHTPSDVWPSPGESKEDYLQRMAKLGITAKDRPANVAEY